MNNEKKNKWRYITLTNIIFMIKKLCGMDYNLFKYNTLLYHIIDSLKFHFRKNFNWIKYYRYYRKFIVKLC